ncbi:MAG TPA: hypothetical protein VIY49_27730 [Bryobacteraceae bacterium]
MRFLHTAMTVAVKNKPSVVVPAAALRRAGFKRGQALEVTSVALAAIHLLVPRLEPAGL